MPRNPFRGWSPNSRPENSATRFAPLFDARESPLDWRPIDYSPVVTSTGELVEARFSDGSQRALKYLCPPTDAAQKPARGRWNASLCPDDHLYWCREAMFYQSEVSRLHTRLFRPVHCLAQAETAGGIALELEWLAGAPGVAWSESDYEDAAFALGDWQRTLGRCPDEAWVCRNWLGGYLAARMDSYASIQDARRWRAFGHFTHKEQALVLRLLNVQDALLASLRKLPQVVAHNDFWPPNLFMLDRQVVAIDWGFAGSAPVGGDIGTLLFDAVFDAFVAPDDVRAMLRRLEHAYTHGLGWQDSAELRFALLAGLVVKYLWFFGYLLDSPGVQAYPYPQAHIRAMRLVLSAGAELVR